MSLLLAVTVAFLARQSSGAADRLLMVHGVMRHGHRAPAHSFPTDPYQESYWPLGFAELTAKGMEDQLELGQWLRQRYVDDLGFLSSTYDRREIYVRSTGIDRAILSGQCQMVGLYGDSGESGRDYPNNTAWPTGLITVPVHTVAQDKVVMLAGCARASALTSLAFKTPEWVALGKRSQPLLANLTKLMKTTVTIGNFAGQVDPLIVELNTGLPVAKWVTDLEPAIRKLYGDVHRIIFGYGVKPYQGVDLAFEIPKVRGGLLLWEIIGRMQTKINSLTAASPVKLKYYLYSAHDIVVMGLLSTFGFGKLDYDRDFPALTGSIVLIEVWQKAAGGYYIKVLYRREGVVDITKDIKGCGLPTCAYGTFVQRSQKYQPKPSVDAVCATLPKTTG